METIREDFIDLSTKRGVREWLYQQLNKIFDDLCVTIELGFNEKGHKTQEFVYRGEDNSQSQVAIRGAKTRYTEIMIGYSNLLGNIDPDNAAV